MVNPGDWGAYLSFMRDNTLDFGVIYQDAMLQPQPPRLLDQVKQTLRLKHFSLKTEKSYVHYIREFILFHNKQHPREMGVAEIRAYLSHLAVEKNVAASTQTVALSAL